jgi:hypothetical protein
VTDERRRALAVFAVALVARLGLVAWAAARIPPTADGHFYDVIARRIAAGQGYTWLWPDGAVTYAAHYPVGYPAIIGAAYALFGTAPVVAMLVNALLGAACAAAATSLLEHATRPRLAMAGGLAVALHPALVPYTAAIMTEGATAALLVLAAAMAERARTSERPRGWLVACGVTMGVVTLVRPQSIVLAPVLGWVAMRGSMRLRAFAAAFTTILAVTVCLPWTARNCARMDKCALVSVNGGWNLAIGTQTTDGGWHEVKVPEACKEVFQEAAKDACFGHAAVETIAAHPGAWIALAPKKLRATFDYLGAAPWYLHTANPVAFPYRAKVALGALETLAARLLLAGALVAAIQLEGPRRRARRIVGGVGLVACVLVPGTIGYLACALALALLGVRALSRLPAIVPLTAALILATAATHAVFFGAGRYGLVVVPFVTALAFVRRDPDDADDAGDAGATA